MSTRELHTGELLPYGAGAGFAELRSGATPAAGAHFVQQIGGDFYTRLLSVFCRLVTAATAAAREVVVEYRDDAANRFALNGAPVTVSASDTVDYAFSIWTPRAEWEVDGSIIVPLAPALLRPTYDFRIFVVNVQAGDQLSRIRFQWERLYTGQDE